MAQIHVEKVLTASGLTADQIKALNELPADAPDFKEDVYTAPIRTSVETAVKNDPKFYETLNKASMPAEFYKQLETEQYGRSVNVVKANILKAVGLTDKDFADLGDEGKKLEVFGPAFAKKLSEGKVTDKELQQKLIEANKQIDEFTQKEPEIEKKYKDQFDGRMQDFQLRSSVLTALTGVPGLTAPAKYLVGDLVNQLKSKYGFEFPDENSVELRQKANPTLKVLDTKGTSELTLAQAINIILTADKLIDPKRTTTTSVTTTKVDGTSDGLKVSKGVNDKMAKRIAEEKAAG